MLLTFKEEHDKKHDKAFLCPTKLFIEKDTFTLFLHQELVT